METELSTPVRTDNEKRLRQRPITFSGPEAEAEELIAAAELSGRSLGYIATTAKLMAAGKVLGIPVVDHIIVTRDSRRLHSMASRGTLPPEA